MSQKTNLDLFIAVFESEEDAEEALKSLKDSHDENLKGMQAAVAMHKDLHNQIHFKDVGMTPAKGAMGGVVLGAVIGILTGGAGIALGAVGAVMGALVGRKRRDSRLPVDRINQIATELAPGASAALIALESEYSAALETRLEQLGADSLVVELTADITAELDDHQETALELWETQINPPAAAEEGS